MDDATTPTPTPTKSIDGMTPGTKAPTPATPADTPAVAPSPIDIKNLDGDATSSDPVVTKTDSDGMMNTSVGSDAAPATEDVSTKPDMSTDVPVAPAPTDDIKPPVSFDAKAAEAAMAEEDSTPAPETPASLSAGGPKITSSMNPAKPKKKGKGLAIFVAVIIALGLIGGASYAFWKNNKDKTVKPAETVTATISVSDTVTTASDGIDTELKKIDDTKEFQATDISDTTLGL
jgi:hypothetical protein